MKERRKSPRVLIHEAGLASKIKHMLLSALRAHDSIEWDPVADLSVGGVAFHTKRELARNESIHMTLRIDQHLQPVELVGEVRRVGLPDERGRLRIAVMFTEYKGEAQRLLQWFEKQYAEEREKREAQLAAVEEVRKQRGLDGNTVGHTPKLASPLLKCVVKDEESNQPRGPTGGRGG